MGQFWQAYGKCMVFLWQPELCQQTWASSGTYMGSAWCFDGSQNFANIRGPVLASIWEVHGVLMAARTLPVGSGSHNRPIS